VGAKSTFTTNYSCKSFAPTRYREVVLTS